MQVAAVPNETVDREYKRHRRSVYAGIFIGYAAYYLVRNNLALAIPDILKEFPQHSKADLGWALTGLSIAYGTSKFLMGSVSDRSNPKYFRPHREHDLERHHVRDGDGESALRIARARHRPAGRERLGAGDGMAAG